MNFIIPQHFKNIYSTLDQGYQILGIIKIFINDNTQNLTITDATGGIGGNSLVFCKYFGFVSIIEIDDINVSIINKNLRNYKNKSIIKGNYIELFTIIKQDIVFIDPPWGENYKKRHENVNLFINEININHIISILYENTKLVFLKAPRNFTPIKINKWKINIFRVFSTNGTKHIYNTIVYYK